MIYYFCGEEELSLHTMNHNSTSSDLCWPQAVPALIFLSLSPLHTLCTLAEWKLRIFIFSVCSHGTLSRLYPLSPVIPVWLITQKIHKNPFASIHYSRSQIYDNHFLSLTHACIHSLSLSWSYLSLPLHKHPSPAHTKAHLLCLSLSVVPIYLFHLVRIFLFYVGR